MKKVFSLLVLAVFLLLSMNVGASEAKTVVFNTKTYKYHDPSCHWADKCTRNCIKIDKAKAVAKGGKACKVCGG